MLRLLFFLLIAPACVFAASEHEPDDIPYIDDTPRLRFVSYPPWFKQSFLDLREDLKETTAQDKWGLIVYFGQAHCAYCEALMEVNFKQPDIVRYTQQHFEIVATDIWGSRELTDMNGRRWTERDYAMKQKTNFTPSLIFFDRQGREAFRIRGYYSPYRFRAALEYVAEGYYQHESFADFMARADPPPRFDAKDLSSEDFFTPPPYSLARQRFAAQQPLVVFFEQGDCHSCDILHSDPLADEQTRRLLEGFEAVQLDVFSETPVITPQGKRLSASAWAKELDIAYTPTLVFFDEQGKEIIRIDALVGIYRLRGVFEYVASKGYLEAPTFQRWRQQQRPPAAPTAGIATRQD